MAFQRRIVVIFLLLFFCYCCCLLFFVVDFYLGCNNPIVSIFYTLFGKVMIFFCGEGITGGSSGT